MHRPQVRWSSPFGAHYKANFDAAFFEESRSAGVGVVVRDCSRQIIGVLGQNIGSIQFVEMAEAMELCLFEVIFEGECSWVLDALKGSGRYCTLFGHIIDEAKRLGGTLRSCLFQHVRRKGNRLAHCLVEKIVLSADTNVWVETLPKDVEDVFQSDSP